MNDLPALGARRGRNTLARPVADLGPDFLGVLVAFHALGPTDDLRALALTHPDAARLRVVRVLGGRGVLGEADRADLRRLPLSGRDRARLGGLLARRAPGCATAPPLTPEGPAPYDFGGAM